MVHLAHDDPEWTIREVALAVRRSIEEQTFVPAPPVQGGVQLLDDQAARYGSFDDVAIVGLIDPDWPERPRRNIFYPPSLLKSLGWPSEQDRRAAADARFRRSPRIRRVSNAVVHVHARRGRPRLALDAARRDPARPPERGGTHDRYRFARVRRRSAVTRAGDARPAQRRGSSLGGAANRTLAGRVAGVPRDGGREGRSRLDNDKRSPLVGQRARNLSRLPVQVLRPSRPRARRGAGRRRGDGSAAAGRLRPRSVRAVLRPMAESRPSGGHARESGPRAGDVHGRRGPRARAPAGCRSRPGAHAAARIVSGRRAWRGGVPHGSRAADRGRRTAARAQARRNLHDGHRRTDRAR